MADHQFTIRGEYITLGQLVKIAGPGATGGEAKDYIAGAAIRVNGDPEDRRGRKLRPGDVVELPGIGTIEMVESGLEPPPS